MPPTYLILGAGLGGVSAAATLRKEGFQGDVVLVGDEPHLPYDRPPLSKQYLRGDRTSDGILLRPSRFYEENGIQTRLGVRATRVDSTSRLLETSDGPIHYDKLLIATGSQNRTIDVPGSDLVGVHGLRTLADADAIRARMREGQRVVIVGMGFIGSELAASFRTMGLEVTVVEALETPLFHVLGGRIGRLVESIHRERGVEILLGETLAAFEGRGRVERAITSNGRSIECDFAVVGVGVDPASELATDGGIEEDDGILVDEYCRTSAEGVYAAGDVTNHYHPVAGRRLRVEHWQNALKQGPAAALNMMGFPTVYDDVHWFWSDQYEYNLQYAGFHSEWDDMVLRGSVQDRSFVAFYLAAGRIAFALALNRGRDLRRSIPLIKAGSPADPKALGDEEVEIPRVPARSS
ncbi:MAG TPA: FAD-dependent oxidoreductase [Actinomycetota bacterium]|nr:FAD-dependent oxidoreductase [Actinomycetota bacterium]